MKPTNVLDAILICITAVALPITMGVMGLFLWKIPYADTSTWYGYIMALSIVEITFFGLLIAKVLIAVLKGIFEIRCEP